VSTPVRSAHVTGWGRYAPSQVLTNHDLERMVDTSDEWIVSRTGIRERRVAAAHETTASMAAVASMRAIRTAGIDPDEIDLILLATLTPDYWMPSTAALVKEAIGNTRAAAMDVAAACSGFVYAYATAQAYITSGMAKHVLVIGAELLTRFLDYTDRNTCILFGDGAGAVVLRRDPDHRGLLGFEMGADGRGALLLSVAAAGHAADSDEGRYVQMNGPEVYKFATRVVVESSLRALEAAGLTVSDVDVFVPHQANRRIIDHAARRMGLDESKVFANVDRYGNTSAGSIPICLDEAWRAGRIGAGDIVLMVGFGGGLAWGSCVMEWTKERP
jgi:3-oxoacyl-[acyl-carrier-protein] synthase-3